MSDEPETVEGDAAADVTPEQVAEALEDSMPQGTDLAVLDPDDEHEVFAVLDAHDEAQILMAAQQRLIKKSLYDFPRGGERVTDLSIEGVLEVVRLINATGKMKVAIAPGSLTVEKEVQDGTPMIVATVYAHDAITGFGFYGTASEPERMRLTDHKAEERRREGKPVGEDNTIFDAYARSKAAGKAQRNALKRFIPEEIRQTLIAQYLGDSRRVERIQTRSEQKLLEAPPALTDDRAKKLIGRAQELYAEIRELAGGRGKTVVTPGHFHAYMVQSHGSHERLETFIEWLEERKAAIPAELELADRRAMALETATKVACPNCGQAIGKLCKGIRGSHPERVAARLEALS